MAGSAGGMLLKMFGARAGEAGAWDDKFRAWTDAAETAGRQPATREVWNR